MRKRRAEPLEKLRQILAVGEIEPAAPGHQQFAAEGRHAVINRDRQPGLRELLGRHEAGGTAADHGDTK